MEYSAIYHRPDSEYAYLYRGDEIHLRLRTKRDDIKAIQVEYGDPYLFFKADKSRRKNMTKVAQTLIHDYWQVSVSVKSHRLQYGFRLEAYNGEVVWYGDYGVSKESENMENVTMMLFGNYFRLPYVHQIDQVQVPDWVANTVWYQIFPDRFYNGDKTNDPENVQAWDPKRSPSNHEFYGGDLQGVLDKLDYLKDLGINGIYLTPIFPADTAHKYDTVDYFEIEPHFGDKEVFRELVKQAHQRGIRIVLDGVFNHIGAHSPQWMDVIEKGPHSAYADWFHIREFPVSAPNLRHHEIHDQLNYETFAFVPQMPKFNTANPEVRDYLISIGRYWMEEFDIDGWRLDVANEVDHSFWKAFRKALSDIRPDMYLVGEIWHSAREWLNGDEFHGVMNYALTLQVKDYFLSGRKDAEAFTSAIQEQTMNYRKQTNLAMMNMLDSHDTERILNTAGGHKGKVKAALAFLFLQVGSPCIYYGTEVGMRGRHDPDCRRVMPWNPEDQDLKQFEFTKALIAFRHKYADIINLGQVQYQILSNRIFSMEITGAHGKLWAYFNSSRDDYELADEGNPVLSHNYRKAGTLSSQGFVVFAEER